MRLNVRRVRVQERKRPGVEVRFREVDRPVVVKWYMTDDERLAESRRIDGIERVELRDLELSQPDRRGEDGGRLRRVVSGAIRWLRG